MEGGRAPPRIALPREGGPWRGSRRALVDRAVRQPRIGGGLGRRRQEERILAAYVLPLRLGLEARGVVGSVDGRARWRWMLMGAVGLHPGDGLVRGDEDVALVVTLRAPRARPALHP